MKQAALERLSAKETTASKKPGEEAKVTEKIEAKAAPAAKAEAPKPAVVKEEPAEPTPKVEAAATTAPAVQTNGVGKSLSEPKAKSSLATAVATSPKRAPPPPTPTDGKFVYTKEKMLRYERNSLDQNAPPCSLCFYISVSKTFLRAPTALPICHH